MDIVIERKQSKPRKPRPRREATANFRVTEYERRALDAMVAKGGYGSLSDLLRAIVRKAIDQERKDN